MGFLAHSQSTAAFLLLLKPGGGVHVRGDNLHGSASARSDETPLLHAELDQGLRVSWARSHSAGSPNSASVAIPSHPLQPSHLSLHSHPKPEAALWGLGSAEPHLSLAGRLHRRQVFGVLGVALRRMEMGCRDELRCGGRGWVQREAEPHSTGLNEAVARSQRCPWASPSM